MKRITLKQAEQRIRQLEKDSGKSMLAMNALAANWVIWLPKFTAEGGSYRVGYFGLTRADGGMVLIQWSCQGQKPYTTVEYLDDAYVYYGANYHSEDNQKLRAAMAYIMGARNKALEAA